MFFPVELTDKLQFSGSFVQFECELLSYVGILISGTSVLFSFDSPLIKVTSTSDKQMSSTSLLASSRQTISPFAGLFAI